MKIESVLGPLFRDLGRPLTLEDSPETVWGWDSLKHLDVILTLEETFDIALTTREIAAMRSVGAVVEILRKRGIDAAN